MRENSSNRLINKQADIVASYRNRSHGVEVRHVDKRPIEKIYTGKSPKEMKARPMLAKHEVVDKIYGIDRLWKALIYSEPSL